MTVFNWLVILIVLLSLLMHGGQKKNWKFILAAVLLMYCVLGLRNAYQVGVDTTGPYFIQYGWATQKNWQEMPKITNWLGIADKTAGSSGHEHNIALTWTMKLYYEATGGTYQGFIEFSSVFVMLAIFYFVYKFSPSPIQSIMLYFGLLFFNFHFSALKQTMAMSVLLFSTGAIIKKKPILFTLLVLFASMFHFPALVFLPAYWIANMRFGQSYIIILFITFLVTYLLRNQLVDWMTDVYSTELYGNTGRFFTNKVIVMVIVILMAIIIRPPNPEDRTYSSFLMLIGIAAVIQTFSAYNNTFERLADYYFQTAIVFIPMIFEENENDRQYFSDDTMQMIRRVAPYIVCAFAIWRFWKVVNSPSSGLVPYSFYHW